MKSKSVMQKPLTREDVRVIVREELKNHPTKEDFQQFKSDFFTHLDELVGKYAQVQEDKLFINHDIKELKKTDKDHEKRLKKLETHTKN